MVLQYYYYYVLLSRDNDDDGGRRSRLGPGWHTRISSVRVCVHVCAQRPTHYRAQFWQVTNVGGATATNTADNGTGGGGGGGGGTVQEKRWIRARRRLLNPFGIAFFRRRRFVFVFSLSHSLFTFHAAAALCRTFSARPQLLAFGRARVYIARTSTVCSTRSRRRPRPRYGGLYYNGVIYVHQRRTFAGKSRAQQKTTYVYTSFFFPSHHLPPPIKSFYHCRRCGRSVDNVVKTIYLNSYTRGIVFFVMVFSSNIMSKSARRSNTFFGK